METISTQLLNVRDNTSGYAPTDGRVDPTICTHSRFMDKNFPFDCTCMDCGSTILSGIWTVMSTIAALDDATLQTARTQYNETWGF